MCCTLVPFIDFYCHAVCKLLFKKPKYVLTQQTLISRDTCPAGRPRAPARRACRAGSAGRPGAHVIRHKRYGTRDPQCLGLCHICAYYVYYSSPLDRRYCTRCTSGVVCVAMLSQAGILLLFCTMQGVVAEPSFTIDYQNSTFLKDGKPFR